jgi:crotonobetainyl-CoA:carnitine CoA-transferase CaiB-like acyl-CoA transferase
MKVGAPITDITAGLLATSGILAALVHRNKTGEGQKVDTSLFEAGIVHTYWQSAIAGATGISPGPLGSAHPLTAPYQAFKTKDKWITVGASNQNTWLMLLKAIDRMDLQENEMFSSNFNRKENIIQLVEIINSELAKKTSKEWLKIFDDNGLPCGPINSINEMFVDPQTIEREMIIDVDNKKAGKSKAIGMPIKFSKSKTEKSKGAPNLGEHTKEIMKIFDYNDKQIDDFYNRKIIL